MISFLSVLANCGTFLTVLKGENCAFLPNSFQKFIEIEAWLLLTHLICLLNQLSSIHFIVTY